MLTTRVSPSGKVDSLRAILPGVVVPAIAAGQLTEVALTVPGALVGDVVSASPQAPISAGFIFIAYARVSAPDTVQVCFGSMPGTAGAAIGNVNVSLQRTS